MCDDDIRFLLDDSLPAAFDQPCTGERHVAGDDRHDGMAGRSDRSVESAEGAAIRCQVRNEAKTQKSTSRAGRFVVTMTSSAMGESRRSRVG
ncbi:MAG: hypothetical protein MZV64_00550 [Ignavibacteriales bacterium]|nr:hypothetical protein [Ignavibacteriales bacterium]